MGTPTYRVRILPATFDHHYCSVFVDRLRGDYTGIGMGVDSRQEAVNRVKQFFERHGGDPAPTETNTEFAIHAVYADAFSPAELLGEGNTTLQAFTSDSRDPYADSAWYEHQPEYQDYVQPVLDGEAVLRIDGYKLGYPYTAWIVNVDGNLREVVDKDGSTGVFAYHNGGPHPEEYVHRSRIVAALGGYRTNGYVQGHLVDRRDVPDAVFDQLTPAPVTAGDA